MAAHSGIYRLQGIIQHYSWGGSRFLPALLNLENNSQQPWAEYWMGAHENAPSRIRQGEEWIPLNHFIQEDPITILGDRVCKAFGRLPYLFKVLDVKDMLSIQVHPSKKAAAICFQEEEARGIPLQAAHRNYKDDNHKPELMLALSEFWLLHGFKEPGAMEAVLRRVPELQFLLPVWQHQSYQGLYREVMQMPQLQVQERLLPLMERLIPAYREGKLNKSGEDFWAARAYETFCSNGLVDRGIFSVYFFNVVHLQPGEAIFQDAGILHAYLEGQNLELMANSDNVLRGGLTTKYIDVDELLRHVRFEPVQPRVIRPSGSGKGQWERYPTPALDFELQELSMEPGATLSFDSETAELFLIIQGSVEVSDSGDRFMLNKGESFLGTSGTAITLNCMERARVFRAMVPAGGVNKN